MAERALITGITGQDGSYLAELLLRKGYSVYGLVRHTSTSNTENIAHIIDEISLIDGDLLDLSSLLSTVEIARPDEIYNLAAMSHVGKSFAQPLSTFEQTGLGAIRMLEAARQKAPGARFYQASTSELFGDVSSTRPLNESASFHPRSPYAVAKLAAHAAAINYREAYGMHVSCGILFNHESPRRGLDFVTRKITRAVARIVCGDDIKLQLGNLDAVRDWGFAGDYVDAMWRMLQQSTPDDYVIATGRAATVREFVDIAFRSVGIYNWQSYVFIDPAQYRPADVNWLCGDASKAAAILDWYTHMMLEQLVSLMVQDDIDKYAKES